MLWILKQVDRLEPEAVLSLLPAVSEDRRARVLAMTHVPAQVRSVLAELLLRHALREEHGLTDLPRMEYGEKGKPFFPDRPDLQFSLSHCATAVVCALSSAPVGVDVQENRPLRRAARPLTAAFPSLPLEGKVPPVRTLVTDEVVPQARKTPPIYRILSETERAWVEAGETPAEQDRRFNAVWTCKEAYGKALGVGTLYDLKATSFIPGPDPWRQYGFCFQQACMDDTILTLCASNPMPCESISFEDLVYDENQKWDKQRLPVRSGGKTMFDVKSVTEACVQWVRDFFEENGPGCNAVLGVSGGKDSSVAAAVCVEALGKDRVIGVLMPNGEQHDIDMAHLLCEHLGIENYVVNIHDAVEGVKNAMPEGFELSNQSIVNLPPRIRMATVYAVSQSRNGRVVNTCNLSEDWVGYSTRYGDAAGDFSPLSHLTVQEVKAVGRYLGLPEVLVEKVPIDGLCGKTDEDNLGFTYAVLDRYIRTGEIDDPETKERIDRLHRRNLFKLRMMPAFDYGIETKADE